MKKLRCFYENDSNKIIASFFDIDITNKTIEYISSYPKINGGAKIIKSIISSDSLNFYVCYLNNDNNCNCLIYNINNNEWSDSINYINNCLI